jgi:hypothetical protein
VGARVRLLILAVMAAVSAVLGMRAHERLLATPAASSPALAPVAAAPGLLGEAVLSTPDATWRKAQMAIGAALMLAPQTFGGLLGAYARVSSLGVIIDGESPAYVVLGDHESWVVAAHVVTAARARSMLVESTEVNTTAPFRVESKVDGLDVLVKTHPTLGDTEEAWLGLSGTWLLVGSDRQAIVTLGPYAFRTLPTREAPRSAIALSVTSAGLASLVRPELEKRARDFKRFLLDKDDEQRRAHGGRAPDLADPKPLVDAADALATRYIGIVAGMQSVDVALDVSDGLFDAEITMMPPSAQDSAAHRWVEDLKRAPAAPLRAANADALVTLFWHSEAAERKTTTAEVVSLLASSLGARVPPQDVGKVAELAGRTAAARGSWAVASVMTTPSPGALLRLSTVPCVQTAPNGDCTTHGATELTSSVEGLIDVLRKPSWAAWERDGLSVTKVERTADHATFDTEASRVQAAWFTKENEVDFAVGLDAASVLATASPGHMLASDPKMGPWLQALGEEVVWVALARPLLLGSSARKDPACLALLKTERVRQTAAPGEPKHVAVAELRALVSAATLGGR